VYIELTKSTFRGDDEAAKLRVAQVLWTCVERSLRLLHPFMPFVTEELWQRLPGRDVAAVATELGDSIMLASYPEGEPEWINDAAVAEVGLLREIVRAVGELRSEYNVNKRGVPIHLVTSDAATAASLTARSADIEFLTRATVARCVCGAQHGRLAVPFLFDRGAALCVDGGRNSGTRR
jgi:valyl-tRNA synthetase